ncbi:MAG: hypothetical protein F6J95_020875 [Leptolyngbya sp. SIO1E4]|nr:hypothetical protein [Leptolyngbya sp. SIO1E4]
MAASSPLTGVVLVDCAKANAKSGPAIAARQCGYGDDVEAFQTALKSACTDMGIAIDDLSELISQEQQAWSVKDGMEVAPDSPGDL